MVERGNRRGQQARGQASSDHPVVHVVGGRGPMNEVSLRHVTSASTHQGQVRDHNEDGWFASEKQGLWAVADGMGGHENGEWASAVVVAALGKLRLDGGEFENCCQQISAAIYDANAEIQREASASARQMGTTAVVLFVRDRRFA